MDDFGDTFCNSFLCIHAHRGSSVLVKGLSKTLETALESCGWFGEGSAVPAFMCPEGRCCGQQGVCSLEWLHGRGYGNRCQVDMLVPYLGIHFGLKILDIFLSVTPPPSRHLDVLSVAIDVSEVIQLKTGHSVEQGGCGWDLFLCPTILVSLKGAPPIKNGNICIPLQSPLDA